MECKNIKVTVIYYYTKYIKVINHGKITYPPNIFIIFHILHQPYYNIIVSGPFFWNSGSLVTKFVPPGCTNTWLTERIFTKHIYETKYNYIGCRLIIHNYSEWPCLINTKTSRCMFYTMHYDSLVLCLCCLFQMLYDVITFVFYVFTFIVTRVISLY